MIGMKKVIQQSTNVTEKTLKTEIFILTMGMENTTNNAVSEQINKNQQYKGIDKDHIRSRTSSMLTWDNERRRNIEILIVSQFVIITMLLVDLHNNQLIYKSKNTMIRNGDAKYLVYQNSFAKYYLYRIFGLAKLGPIVIVFA